ncbi:hypothetical protein LTS17_001755 [Exophiala oligosperma]
MKKSLDAKTHMYSARVVIGDIDEQQGSKLQSELHPSTKFVKCDVSCWEDQVSLFKEAIKFSSSGAIDIVVVNAGIGGVDSVFNTTPEDDEPQKPQLRTLDINLTAALYTIKLGLYYFRRQAVNSDSGRDHCLVLQGSVAGYIDFPGMLEYGASKFGMRSAMRNIRSAEDTNVVRVNMIAPWFIATDILPPGRAELMKANGIEFASLESAAEALMRIVSSRDVSGRAFAIVPKTDAPSGYIDLDVDDFRDCDLMKRYNKLVRNRLG